MKKRTLGGLVQPCLPDGDYNTFMVQSLKCRVDGYCGLVTKVDSSQLMGACAVSLVGQTQLMGERVALWGAHANLMGDYEQLMSIHTILMGEPAIFTRGKRAAEAVY